MSKGVNRKNRLEGRFDISGLTNTLHAYAFTTTEYFTSMILHRGDKFLSLARLW